MRPAWASSRLWAVALAWACLLTGAARPQDGEEQVFSGPQVGEKLRPFDVVGVYDDLAGRTVDFVAEAGDRPLLLVFVHQLTRPSHKLARIVTDYVAEHTKGVEEDVLARVVWLAEDRSEAVRYLQRARSSLGWRVPVGVSVDGLEGPGSYGLNRNVTLTVLLGREGRVTANFALIQPGDPDATRILAELAPLFGEVPPADDSGLGSGSAPGMDPGMPGMPGMGTTAPSELRPADVLADHLELDVTLEPENARIAVRARYTYHVGEAAVDRVALYLSSAFTIERVECEGLAYAYFEPGGTFLDAVGKELTFVLREPAPPGSAVDLTVEYSGTLEGAIRSDWIELFADQLWSPVHRSLGRDRTFDCLVRLGEGYRLVGNGSESDLGGGVFRLTSTVPTNDVSLVASPRLATRDYLEGEQRVRVAADDPGSETAASVALEAFRVLRLFDATFGRRDPSEQVEVVLRQRSDLPSYARAGYLVLHSASATPERLELVGHELSHLWWHAADSASYEDWLNESFATYSGLLALRELGDEGAYAKRVGEITTPAELPPIVGLERSDPRASAVLYRKGPRLLLALEERLGRERFRELLLRTASSEVGTTDAFVALVAEVGGRDAADWLTAELSE